MTTDEGMEKRNIVEQGRTPPDPAKMAEVADEAAGDFDKQTLTKESKHERLKPDHRE